MRKILSLILGLLWALPVWGACYDYTSATGTVVQDGTPTPTNPIYPTFYKQGDMVLRKVGNIADSYDASTGKITRRVGEYIFTGRESIDRQYNVYGVTTIPYDMNKVTNASLCSHNKTYINTVVTNDRTFDKFLFFTNVNWVGFGVSDTPPEITDTETFKQWLAAQYAAGTPVKIYYPLDTEVVEDWTGTRWCDKIEIATTKYNETAFSPLNTALANAISVVDTVVSNTITQAASIATLQAQKQTRPNDIADDNEKCPAGKKCLLVEDASGIPHWYEIVENAWDLPVGYTQLQYIESTGTQYIDTGIIATNWDWSVEFEMSVPQAGDMFFGAGRGLWGSADWGAQFGLANSSGNANWGAGSGGMNVVISNLGVRTDTFYNYKMTKEGLYINGELKSRNTATESFSNSDLSLWICKTNNPGVSGYNYNRSASSWKYVRIYNADNALVFNGVPAKNPDGKIGMYDKVSGEFFENKGTGDFIAGPVAQ